jgi:hypothetical protein
MYNNPRAAERGATEDLGGLDLCQRLHHGKSTGLQDVGLAEQVLRESRVETDHIPHAAKSRGLDLESLRRHEPRDALAARRGGEGAGVSKGTTC